MIVVGGGITGAGILRDCALRGLKALLVERASPGNATTAASTHLIHGGLRYLLYDRLTTHATAWDAGHIAAIAGPLLRRLPILWPLYREHGHGPETVETLLEVYDDFQAMKGGLPHLRLGAAETLRLVPALRPDGLLGAVSFDEWWVDPVALVERNLEAARACGAVVRTHTRVTGLIVEDGAVRGVRCSAQDGKLSEARAGVVINAAGPWAAEVSRMGSVEVPLILRRGTHLVYDRRLVETALILEAADRERIVFVIPFENGGPGAAVPEGASVSPLAGRGGTLIGPTDVKQAGGPDTTAPDDAEVRYLLDSVRRWLPNVSLEGHRSMAGARPLLDQGGGEKLLSREFEICDHAAAGVAGFLTVAGGKMSDFRLMAKEAVDAACAKLGNQEPCLTHRQTLDGRPIPVRPPVPGPSRPLAKFLRRHPRLREGYAYAHLAVAFLKHLLRLAVSGKQEVTADDFRRHYSLKP